MGHNSTIEWTDHTFNPWWGCEKVSLACDFCYAETWARRVGQDVWGKGAPRRFFGEVHWNEPLRWNATAKTRNVRFRVFCASMADVFEQRAELQPWRDRLWQLVEQTSCLDWLLLTKRPRNIASMVPWRSSWPENIWLGTTAENQEWYDVRASRLSEIPAAKRFLSCEPLLGPIRLNPSWHVDWIIAGGESGSRARPTHPEWLRRLRDQCVQTKIAFHFKQWGGWAPRDDHLSAVRKSVRLIDVADGITEQGDAQMVYVGKGSAGRLLDGREWDELPSKSDPAASKLYNI